MMRYNQRRICLGSSAIAAAMALTSTPVLAQDVQPATTDTTPAPATDSSPVSATDTSTTTTTTSSNTADQPKRSVTTTRKTTVTTQSVAHKTSVPKAAPKPTAMPAAQAAAAPVGAAPAKPAPIVDLSAKPATPAAPSAPAAKPMVDRNEALMFGGGALALLALAAAAIAASRRRRNREIVEQSYYEPEATAEPAPQPELAHQPPIVSPAASAFAWNREPERADERRSDETWVERAYRGPTAENPSLSLRKRLKRAAFFDKRDRDAAAGKAVPVEDDAGLPDNLESTHEHMREAA